MEPKAHGHSVTPVVPQAKPKSKKHTKEDIQEMLGRFIVDKKVVFLCFYFYLNTKPQL